MEYIIHWTIKGRTFIEADNEDKAASKFNAMYATDIIEGFKTIQIEDIEEERNE